MRKLVLLFFVFLPALLLAQLPDAPKVDVYGGYSYLHGGGNSFNGWEGQGTFYLNRFVGVTADVSGDYRNGSSFIPFVGGFFSAPQHLYTYLFGPTVIGRFGKHDVFAHALFGGAHSSLGGSVSIPIVGGFSQSVESANSFAMALGAGVDFGITKHFAVRPVQIDYLYTRFNAVDAVAGGLSTDLTTSRQNTFRYSGGLVFRF